MAITTSSASSPSSSSQPTPTNAPAFADATATDPRTLGWMQGFPPPPDKLLRFDDGSYYDFPQRRWSFSHMRELLPTVRVSRGDGLVCAVPRADRDHFATAGYSTLPGWSYRNMWWVSHDPHQCFTARGIHGQLIWVDPTAEMVIARYGSHPLAANTFIDPNSLPAYRALGTHLLRS